MKRQSRDNPRHQRGLTLIELTMTIVVLGIIGVLCWFMGWSSILSVILGVVGLIFAGKAKSAGYESSIRTAGFVLSLISLIGGALVFIACLACVGSLAAIASSGALH